MEVVSNQDNKRTRPRFVVGVGGVEGLLVLGGSLAIAGLMALFTIKTTKSSQRSVDDSDNIIDETKETICIHNNDGLQNTRKKEGLELVVLDQDELPGCNDTNGGSNADLRDESISSQVSTVDQTNEEEKGVVEAEKEEEEAQCQHEILVLSDDSTPPESVVSCDDYTESTDLSLGEEEDEQKVGEKEAYEDGEEVEGSDSNDYESSEEEDDSEEEEVTECSSSLSSLAIEEATPIYVKEFADIDTNYECIAKELNSFNSLGLWQKFDTSSGMFGSGTHLQRLVGTNEMAVVTGPPPLTKARLWLMVVPVVMVTMVLAMIHFFVVDNYVMDMEF